MTRHTCWPCTFYKLKPGIKRGDCGTDGIECMPREKASRREHEHTKAEARRFRKHPQGIIGRVYHG